MNEMTVESDETTDGLEREFFEVEKERQSSIVDNRSQDGVVSLVGERVEPVVSANSMDKGSQLVIQFFSIRKTGSRLASVSWKKTRLS
jgi:hypothetical protein